MNLNIEKLNNMIIFRFLKEPSKIECDFFVNNLQFLTCNVSICKFKFAKKAIMNINGLI